MPAIRDAINIRWKMLLTLWYCHRIVQSGHGAELITFQEEQHMKLTGRLPERPEWIGTRWAWFRIAGMVVRLLFKRIPRQA